ncbi:MAG: phosphonate C-P lyase system protein PhnH [Pseudomonadota bacterium]
MRDEALAGGFVDAPLDAARAFRAAMNVMAKPGRIETVAGAMPPDPLSVAAGVLILTLCDAETPLCVSGSLNCPAVRDWITFHASAPFVDPADAVFAIGSWADLKPLDPYQRGTPEYPDRSTTLIVEMPELLSEGTRLTGPGIKTSTALNLPEIEAFQQNAALYPLGLDFFFTCSDRVAALPRTTKVEAG